MVVYTAHAPAGTAPQGVRDGDKVVFVKDGFAWGALVFSFLWLFWHRCWIAGLAVMALTVAMSVLAELYPHYGDALGTVGLLFSILVGFEANGWWRWSLSRKGQALLGVVAGADLAECERRFFDNWTARPVAAPAPRPAAPARMSVSPGVVGVFPERGR